MKYINSIWNFLLESIESYNWEFDSDNDNKVKYFFIDNMNNKYLVEFKNKSGKSRIVEYELSYYVYDSSKKSYDVNKLVNVNPYKTIKTVLGDILHDFIERNPKVKKITMVGLPKEREREYVSQRTKMYVRYLERNPLPGWKMVNYGNKINLIKI